MPHLYRNFRVNQIFGANTEVGKTLITTALVLAESKRLKDLNKNIFYLKPVSTGPDHEQDDSFVKKFSDSASIQHHTLFRYTDPVSPHLAVSRDQFNKSLPPNDNQFVNTIHNYIDDKSNDLNSHSIYIETAGGVHSPTLTGTSQADAYRSLSLPTILVASSQLGGISTTLAAYESLHIRGYNIESILVFKEDYYANYQYLSSWGSERGIHVGVIDMPPSKDSNALNDKLSLQSYFETLLKPDSTVNQTLDELNKRHKERIDDIRSMPKRTLDSIWYPFAQHSHIKNENDIGVIDSAHNDQFDVYRYNKSTNSILNPEFDGSASWWTQTLGHGNPILSLAAANAAGRYGHVLLPGHTHKPVLDLCENLLNGIGKNWASKVFITDNGSTAMEVALKIALRAASKKYGEGIERGILGLSGSYHGDTIGSMDASEPSVYNNAVEWYRPRGGFWFEAPQIRYKNNKVILRVPKSMGMLENAITVGQYLDVELCDTIAQAYNIKGRINDKLAKYYSNYIESTLANLVRNEGKRFGALVLEPLVMGAGGMICVDPLYQRVLVDVVRNNESLFAEQVGSNYNSNQNDWKGLPIVFDEVFTGIYRLGQMSPAEMIDVKPDISAFAKILSGGIVPLSATLARKSFFDNFLGSEKSQALLHGHSYTAHPIGCTVANTSINEIKKLTSSDSWITAKKDWNSDNKYQLSWSLWSSDVVNKLSTMENVDGVMALGTLLIVHLKSSGKGYESNEGQRFLSSLSNQGIHSRPLGDTVYFMTSLNTSISSIKEIESKIVNSLKNF